MRTGQRRYLVLSRPLFRGQAIPFENEHGRMDFHALRDTFCTTLLSQGVHPRVAQELMRHSDISLTMKNYTDMSQMPVAEALDKLPVHRPSVQKETGSDSKKTA